MSSRPWANLVAFQCKVADLSRAFALGRMKSGFPAKYHALQHRGGPCIGPPIGSDDFARCIKVLDGVAIGVDYPGILVNL